MADETKPTDNVTPSMLFNHSNAVLEKALTIIDGRLGLLANLPISTDKSAYEAASLAHTILKIQESARQGVVYLNGIR